MMLRHVGKIGVLIPTVRYPRHVRWESRGGGGDGNDSVLGGRGVARVSAPTAAPHQADADSSAWGFLAESATDDHHTPSTLLLSCCS